MIEIAEPDFDRPTAANAVGRTVRVETTADLPSLTERFPSVLPVFSIRLSGGEQRLSTPLIVEVSRESDGVLLSSPALRVTGGGATLSEAIEDFLTLVSVQAESLLSSEDDSLTPGARAVKNYLQTNGVSTGGQ